MQGKGMAPNSDTRSLEQLRMLNDVPEKLVARAFELLLGRPPSDAELASLSMNLDGALGALTLLEAIAESAEYKESRKGGQSIGCHDFVELMFDVFLGRAPSEAETGHFAYLRRTGSRPEDLLLRLYESEEFRARRTVRLYAPPGHFYSPIVNSEELKSRFPQVRPAIQVDLPDVQIDIDAMEQLWTTLLPILRNTPFGATKTHEHRYYFDNPAFSFADSMMLRAIILHHRPRRIVEVGSGFSSACMLDTVFDEAKLDCAITFVEPYPDLLRSLMRADDSVRVSIVSEGVQTAPLTLFKQLRCNDILFIDSTHVVKTESDVVHELSAILPVLSPGVIVHFHDVFYPFEYPYDWVINQNRSWNEIYALRAFLAFNSRFEVIFFNDMFGQLRREFIGRTAPEFLRNTGGSIWLRVREPVAVQASVS